MKIRRPSATRWSSVARATGLFLLLSPVCPFFAQASGSEPSSGLAIVRVDRNVVVSPLPSREEFLRQDGDRWPQVGLNRSEVDVIQRTLASALLRHRKEEREAARIRQGTGGVPGCMSFDYRIMLRYQGTTQPVWFHLCAGWVQGGSFGPIVLSAAERQTIEKVLKAYESCS